MTAPTAGLTAGLVVDDADPTTYPAHPRLEERAEIVVEQEDSCINSNIVNIVDIVDTEDIIDPRPEPIIARTDTRRGEVAHHRYRD